ncbi:hypothetical protein AXA44_05680 [Rhodococcus sp. SC4]|uniref:amidohydrolase family protein n=1 Tax=Rhodococcus sp. LB1 TaxID=1807499 RepID=UPI00076A027A|nr:amidohydrolase family protein [Rhodococcus sp. LB1]KXF54717.1 hypothetical protein AXA44_05680 [Rhodococcus sp. SC4]KXX55969.1 hypothetical protein AZG88_16980 [Rhodococcus sp. LB1]
MNARTVFRDATVISMDPAIGTLENADVLVENDTIVHVGPGLGAVDAQEIDGTGAILTPGFVDTHRHLWQSAIKGVFADWTTLQYMHGIRLHIAPMVTADDTYTATYAGALECLNNGVTTVLGYEHNVNTTEHAFAGAQAMVDAGVRGVYALGMGQAPLAPRVFSRTADYIPVLDKLRDQFFTSATGRVQLGVAPVELFMASEDVVAEQFALARSFGATLTLHINAVQNSVGEITRLAKAGLIAPDIVFVHGEASTDNEYRQVADNGAAICACVEAEMAMAQGEPSLRKQREFGLAPTVGVDSVGCCGGGIVSQVRMGMQIVRLADAHAQLAAGHNPEAVSVTAGEALEWGTINGAKALGIDSRTGSITVGKQADLVLFRATSPDMAGYLRSNPAAAVVTQSSAADIDTVMVAGDIVKYDGKLRDPGWGTQRSRLTDLADRIAEQARQTDGSLIPSPPPQLPTEQGW